MITNNLDSHIQALKKGYEEEAAFFVDSRKHFPSKSVCIKLVEEIRTLLFPGYFDMESEPGTCSSYLVAERLIHINRMLHGQIYKAMLFENAELGHDETNEKADEIVEAFLGRLSYIQSMMLKDVQAMYEGDPAAGSYEEILVAYPGIYAILAHRIAHELWALDVPLIPRLISEHAHSRTGIDIGPGAQIGEYFFIDHGTGVVIGETTIIGNHVKLYQGVTLGATSTRKGQALHGVKRHPTLEDYVTVYSNASILGGDTLIGEGAVIGGSAFVCESIPANARVGMKDQGIVIR